MNLTLALSWVGVMLVIGVVLRSKIKFLSSMLVPSSLTAGLIGFVLMNTVGLPGSAPGDYSLLVSSLFTLSFISIGLTSTEKSENKTQKETMKNIFNGSIGMALVWLILYALTAVVSYYAIKILNTFTNFGMSEIYGLLSPFAFAQGPGQSATFGGIIESYGYPNAAMVAMTLAGLGFLYNFLVGVPIAKLGIKKGLAKHSTVIDDTMLKGVYPKDEQPNLGAKATTHPGNIDTLAFHGAVVGLGYILAAGITYLQALLVPSMADTFWGLMFLNGMIAAYIIKFVMGKLKITYMLNNTTQKHITGYLSDFVVVCSFMAVKLDVISAWMIPILIISVVTALVTFVICFYFGCRFGGENDFERLIALWSVCTGTVPTAIAMVRIVDPKMETTTLVELGGMNLPMMAFMISVAPILALAAHSVSETWGMMLLLAPIAVYLVLLKILKLWNKKSFNL